MSLGKLFKNSVWIFFIYPVRRLWRVNELKCIKVYPAHTWHRGWQSSHHLPFRFLSITFSRKSPLTSEVKVRRPLVCFPGHSLAWHLPHLSDQTRSVLIRPWAGSYINSGILSSSHIQQLAQGLTHSRYSVNSCRMHNLLTWKWIHSHLFHSNKVKLGRIHLMCHSHLIKNLSP